MARQSNQGDSQVSITIFRPTINFEGYLDVFNSVEVHPVYEDEENNCEICEPEKATMWSVYLHYNPQAATNNQMEGVICVADFETKGQAYIFGIALDTILMSVLPPGQHIPMNI
jgi:hypothetical protein